MAVYFFDSSALIKRYINETGTAWVQSLTDAASGHEIYIARVTTVEVVAAVTLSSLWTWTLMRRRTGRA